MDKFIDKWIFFISYVSVFIIGAFAASQFKFGEPVELYRWAIQIIILLVCLFWNKIDFE